MHAFLYPNKVVSTIPHPPRGWAPFLSRKELRSACFPFISFRILAFLQKCYSQNPPADWLCKSAPLSSNLLPFFYARSRESNMDSCRLMSLCSYRPANPRRIRTDSKHSLRLFDMSFLLVTRLLNSRVCLFCTVSSRRLAAFVFLPVFLSTVYSLLYFLSRLQGMLQR